MDLVDHLVQFRSVQRPVRPIVPRIFHDEEDGDLIGHGEDGRKRNGG